MKRFAGIREGTFRDFLKSTPDSKIVGAFNRLGLDVMSRHPTRNGASTIGETFSFRDHDSSWGGTLWTFKDSSRCEVYLHTGGSLGVYTTKTVDGMVSLLNYFAKFVMPKAVLHHDKQRVKQAKNLMHRFSPQQQESAARDFFKKLGRQLRWEEYTRNSQYDGYDDTFKSPGGTPKALQIAKWWIDRQNLEYWAIDTYYDPQPPIGRVRFATAEKAMKAANEWWFKEGRALMMQERTWRHMVEAFEPGDARKFLASICAVRIPDAQVVTSGAKFRRLVGRYPALRVEVWKESRPQGHVVGTGGILIVILQVNQGFGCYVKYAIRQNWSCYDWMREKLMTWRNLQGAPLRVNGVDAGVVSHNNPALKSHTPNAAPVHINDFDAFL